MAVIIGSARGDERGKAHGGQAGDQNGREVSTQNWYKHSKGWRVLRAKDPKIGQYMAEAMRSACNNKLIGYDQYQNQTLWNAVKTLGYDPAKVTKAVETDCARLVRVCAQYACTKAGLNVTIPDFYTANLASRLLGTGLFTELKGSKYTGQSTYLGVGDVLVTSVKGHVVIVLTNGSKYEGSAVEAKPVEIALGERILKEGCEGDDVRTMQKILIDLGYDLGSYGADGDFGDATELAVMKFQKDHGCKPVDGQYGPITHEALLKAMDNVDNKIEAKTVQIVNGQCWIRTLPSTAGEKLAVAKRGDKFEYAGEIAENNWPSIKYNGKKAWVSDNYSTLID